MDLGPIGYLIGRDPIPQQHVLFHDGESVARGREDTSLPNPFRLHQPGLDKRSEKLFEDGPLQAQMLTQSGRAHGPVNDEFLEYQD